MSGYLKETKHITTAYFRGDALEDKSVPSSLEERSPTSHMNAPPPGVGKPTLRETCDTVANLSTFQCRL